MLTTEFLLTSLVVVLIPGTGVLYTVSTGLFAGGRASVAAAIGCTFGIVPHLLASITGLAAILHMSAVAFQAVKFAGVAYLLYLAWGMWRDTGVIRFRKEAGGRGYRQLIVRGFLINILNPKLSIFFLAFLPQFVAADGASPLLQMLMLAGLFMLMTLVIFVLYGLGANGVRSSVTRSPKWVVRLQRSFAIVFAGLAARLATAEQ